MNEQNEHLNTKTMKSKRSFLILFLLTLSISSFAQTDNLSKDWIKFEKCGFTFSAPKTLKDLTERGIDSCAESLQDKNIIIHIDLGWYSDNFEGKKSYPNFTEENLLINGRKAKFVTYVDDFEEGQSNVAGLYIKLKSKGVMTYAVDIKIIVSDKKDLKTAKQIFRTIKFQK